MVYDKIQLLSLLRLNQLPLAGRREITERLILGEMPSEIEARIVRDDLANRSEKMKEIQNSFDAEREVDKCNLEEIHLLSFQDPNYPRFLARIFNPPWILYVRGALIPEDDAAFAIVGTRHPSFYGISQTRRFSKSLADTGLTIISGLAKGVDREAHDAALQKQNGRTIAVLGCGVDLCYPSGNRDLYEKIQHSGAIISEYPLGSPPLAHHFPVRNRIIAGWSAGVLVIEAHTRSGALITAHEAADEGREVFALPGPVDQLTSRGSHRLIKEGAALIECPEEILEIVLPSLKREALIGTETLSTTLIENLQKSALRQSTEINLIKAPSMTSVAERVYEEIKSQVLGYDELYEKFPEKNLMLLLIQLEMMGKIRKLPNGSFEAV